MADLVTVPVDPIIEIALFDAVQARLKSSNTKQTPPRVVTGPILLTGLATCASCGGGMTLRTGKSGRYRYSTCAQQGKSACPGRSVPMDKLDRLVTDQLNAALFTPERVRALLGVLLSRQTSRSEDHPQRLTALQNKLAECESRLSRLHQAIENGIAEASDPTRSRTGWQP